MIKINYRLRMKSLRKQAEIQKRISTDPFFTMLVPRETYRWYFDNTCRDPSMPILNMPTNESLKEKTKPRIGVDL